jgi:hypothetical protein
VKDELARCRGTQFDPEVVDALLASNTFRYVAVSPPHPWPTVDFNIRRFAATQGDE